MGYLERELKLKKKNKIEWPVYSTGILSFSHWKWSELQFLHQLLPGDPAGRRCHTAT